MAGAGFLFTPHEPGDDTAKCPYCGIELSGWEPHDDPVYVLLFPRFHPPLTLPERNTGGGTSNVAQIVPSSPRRLRHFQIRRPFEKLCPKRLYKLRNLLEAVPPRLSIRDPILTIRRKILEEVLAPGRQKQRKPPPEVPLPLGPGPRLRSSRQMNLARAI